MCESRSIVDVILGWSIDDITNPYLLRDKVKCLPKEFSSVDHYLESFRYPLIEEARSDLATRLFAVSEAPYVGIIVRNCIDAAGKKCDRDNIFSFSLYLAEQRGWYEPRVGDVVLLSTFVPKDSEDLQKGMSLAVVNEIGNEDRRECKGKMGATDGNEIMGGGSSYIALYLLNITEISHVWNSLNVDSNDPNINFDMIKKAFCHGSMVSKSCTCTPLKIRKEITSKINESQIDAVYSAVFPFSCNHSVSIKCISGKTATGKSEVASRIALAALSLNLKVILCMPEKISVVDAVSRFFKIVDGEHCGFNLKDIAVYGENSENPLDIYGDHISRTSDLSFCLEKIRLIICSVASLSSMKRIGTWDALIIDDASRVKECDLIVPLQLKGLRHVILAGNEYDLPPTTSSKISEDVGFTRSLFERFTSLCPPKKLFDIQYRMHPEISYFPTKRVLKCQLLNGPNVMDRIPLKHQLLDKIYKPYSFLDVADGKEEMHDDGDDWKNVVEAAVVIKILQKLFHACVISRLVLSVGVISPYEAQVQIIEDMIPERFTSNSDFSLWVRTFDQTQSSEADVIIISTVRCNATGVGCLSARYHMSISLTRARHYLWVVGNGSNLVKSHSIWQDLVLDAVERGCTFHVGEDKDLARVVIDVKRELDELDDLLNQESVLFNDKMWKVIFSDDFKHSFVALKSLFIKQIVLGFLLRLASGWRPKRRCHYSLEPSLCNYVKLYKVHGLYLVCTTDVVSDSKFIQVLRIWDILPLVEIPKLIKKLEDMISLCSDYYKERCLKEKYEGKLVVPMTWNICSDFIKYNQAPSSPGHTTNEKLNSFERSKVVENLLLMKFYSVSSVSVKSLLKACHGREIELPFEVSDLELEVINYHRSAFILGRSGTGKTIVSILKMIQREQEYMEAVQGIVPCNYSYHGKGCQNHAVAGNGLCQIFVTVNTHLCLSVKDYITRIRRCVSGVTIECDTNEGKMCEIGDGLCMFSDIPYSFIDIPQKHFPLVIPLDKFLLMLDGSLSCSYFDRFHDVKGISDGNRSAMTHAKLQLVQGKEVQFERFLISYWPKFNVKFTKELDPLLVFTQVISVIKGGYRFGIADHHEKMNEDDYINLSNCRMSTLRKEKRQMIYKLYLKYEKMKNFNGEYDISDLVIDIHQRLKVEGYAGPKMDFIYIDEVQDFSLNQLSLFKYISSNVREGFLFSGDTAQTITKGVDFRFEDIRSLFYTNFLHSSEKLKDLFKLYQNFRTHAAILNLAQSVLKLLFHFFPYSFDKLESETSILQGELPVLLESCDENVLKNFFCSDMGNEDGLITFGAQQVILVRDKYVKKQVIDQIGNKALVLTVIECKGLEFQDVLLYNFFEKSPMGKKWRVIYNFMAHEHLWDSCSPDYPDFDEDKHSTMCSELKELYVAITRTRQRLWIFEKTSEAEPLFDYWKKLGVVKQGGSDISFTSNMQVFCKPEDWNMRGQKFFNEGNYETASFCFKRSGDNYRWKWAKAASLQKNGENNLNTDFELASTCLCKAAECYEEIGKMESAVTCFLKLGRYNRASEIYLNNFQNPRFEDAGDCLALGGCWSDAAKIYAKGKCLTKCLSACKKGDLLEVGWFHLRDWPGNVTDDKVNFLKYWISKIYNNSQIEKAVENARAFPADAYRFLLERGNYVEALELESIKGNILGEADVFEKAREYGKSLQLVVFQIAVQILSVNKRRCCSVQPSQNLETFLRRATELANKVSKTCRSDTCAELDFLSDESCKLSEVLAHFDRAKSRSNVTVETFAIREILDIYLKERLRPDPDGFFKWRSCSIKSKISKGQCSAQIMMNAWNIWKERITSLFSYLQGSSEDENYKDLCQKYFGVLKLRSRDVYVAFNSRASWLDRANENALHRIDNNVYMSGKIFRSLGQKFLRLEVSYLCHNLLGVLTQSLNACQEKKFHFIQRAVLALQISGIFKFDAKYGSNTLRSFDAPDKFVVKGMSPLDYTEDVRLAADLQEISTAVKAVGLVLHANLNSFKSGSTPTKIAWAIVFLFFSRILIDELTWEVVKRYELEYQTWKNFFNKFLNYKDNGFKDPSPLARAFLDALHPVDPPSQVHLIESLLFITSSCLIRRGCFFMTKSMICEAVCSKDSEAFQYALLGFSEQCGVSIKHIYDFILAVVYEILLNRRFVWARENDNKTSNFHQKLILRLVSVLCLLCLNSVKHLPRVRKILRKCAGVLLLLPPHFQFVVLNVINGRLGSFKLFAWLFSKALETINNKVVIIHQDDYATSFAYLKPITIRCSFFDQRKDVQLDYILPGFQE